MRKSALAALVAATVLVLVAPAAAQNNAAPTMIAIIDINYLIKENPHLKAMMGDMKAAVARAEETLNKQREEIRTLSEQIKQVKAGTLDYKKAEEDLTKKSTDLNVQVQLQRKDFLQQESKIYFTVYQEIWAEVDAIATQYNIAVVLKTSNEQVDVNKPEEILREMNKQIIWHAKSLDITTLVHRRLLDRYGSAANTAARQGVPAPSPR